jgi:ribosomal protein L11 methyltransferase
MAAAKLGYQPVEAFDFDPDCVRIAKENASLNQLDRQISITKQDVTRLPSKAAHKFDMVCANLIYDLLIAVADRIAGRVKPDGILVLAGILAAQFVEVQIAYESRGWKLIRAKSEKEWRSGAFSRISK